MANHIPNGNFKDNTSWTENDGVITNGRMEFNALDGGNVGSVNVSGLTVGVRYALEWMQEVTPGDSVRCFPGSEHGHGRSGPCREEYVATDTGMSVLFRQNGSNGFGWIDAVTMRPVE